jgi:hypothetical protein
MLDCESNQPIEMHTDGDAGPYLLVPEQQVDAVQAALRTEKIAFWTDLGAISLDNEPAYAAINLGRHADLERVRHVLDEAPQPPEAEDAHAAGGQS